MKKLMITSAILLASNFAYAGGMNDDPLLTFFKADQFEIRDSDEGNLLVWELDAWLGKDLNKFWIKVTGESVDGDVESQEIDLLYSKAVNAYWDLQMGLRTDIEASPKENWIGVGLMGIAPYTIEMDMSAFTNKDGIINLRLQAEYEYMFSQRLVLVPEIELNAYTDNDDALGISSGLANIEIGLRLSYEIIREFAPYIGINYEAALGSTADKIKAGGGNASETQLLLGVRAWF